MTTSTVVSDIQTKSSVANNWADFNTLSLEGRIAHAEIKTSGDNEYVLVNVMTTLKDGTPGVTAQFSSSNGILTLARKGYLQKGRRVHVTGSLIGFETHYDKDGTPVVLQRGRVRLGDVRIKLGATPKSQSEV